MSEIYQLIRDLGPAANTTILLAVVYFLREVRVDIRDIKDNHLPHINDELRKLGERISAIEGVKSGVEMERMKEHK